jgi:hypothetical protein
MDHEKIEHQCITPQLELLTFYPCQLLMLESSPVTEKLHEKRDRQTNKIILFNIFFFLLLELSSDWIGSQLLSPCFQKKKKLLRELVPRVV